MSWKTESEQVSNNGYVDIGGLPLEKKNTHTHIHLYV